MSPQPTHFRPQGHKFEQFGRSPLAYVTHQISGSKPCGFRQEDFLFTFIRLNKTSDPWGRLFLIQGA